ncbi:MAG TPA: NAD(P)H-binding protein [Streptosporangiaceae bacterium]|nr:NAD(P)H-binding protein [Streptosporangiaceae bacterium]
MLLAVFGGTGGTGTHLIRQALDRGHHVAALARRPEAMRLAHPRLRVVRGDVVVPGAADPVVEGADAVLSALGIGYRRHATTVYSAGTGNILAAMGRAQVRRLLVVSTSSLSVPDPGRPVEWAVARLILQPLLRRPYADMALMEQRIRKSGTDWTVARAARLTNGSGGRPYRTAVDSRLPGCWSVSRADLASYLLDHIWDHRVCRATMEIAY